MLFRKIREETKKQKLEGPEDPAQSDSYIGGLESNQSEVGICKGKAAGGRFPG